MPRILKAYDPFTPKTLQSANRKRVSTSGGVTQSPIEISKHDPRLLVGRTTSKRKVRVLSRHDPYNMNSVSGIMATGATQALLSPEFDQFTNSTNVKYDPSKSPGAVRKVSAIPSRNRANTPGKASRGHQRVVRRTLFNQNAGKTLRRL